MKNKNEKNLDGKPIHLCFISDENYVLPTLVALESLKVNKHPVRRYIAHIICRNVSQESLDRLEAMSCADIKVETLQRTTLPVDESKVSLVRHVSPAAIFKFFIPELLPNLDRVIYLDSDILIQSDLAELWQTDIASAYAAVVKDNQTITGRDKHLKWLGFNHAAYFNSGVMLLNLARMRHDDMPKKLIDYRIHGKNRFMDQDALNMVFGDCVKYVSIKYNCLNWLFIACTTAQLQEMFGAEDIASTQEETCSRAVILHIGGSEKPWLCDMPYYTPLYRKYAERIGWDIHFPKVSVVVPVFNAAKHLRTTLGSICAQTLKELDIILVDNGSKDKSPEIEREFADKDKRVRVFSVEKKGAGVCRNFGISRARGDYVGFVDADDFIDPNFFETLHSLAVSKDADVSMTSRVNECNADGRLGKMKDVGDKRRKLITCIRDRGDLILASGVTWNKIYRRQYLVDNNIRYSESPCAGEDKLFDFGMLLTANRIAVTNATTYFYRQSGKTSESFRRKGRESFAIIEFHRDIKKLIDEQPLGDEARTKWRSIAKRVRDAEFRIFASRMDPELRLEFIGRSVEAFYDDSQSTRKIQGLIVSLTSFPARINTVHRTIKTILGQSVRPEKTVLWLAKEQFPGGLEDLPQQLIELVQLGLDIEWYHDIRSYKKLIPTLIKYPQHTIVTADDDVLYPRYWLEKLWQTHLDYPRDIIVHRARRVETFCGRIRPYRKWPIVTRSVKASRHHVLPTGCAGILYPAHALPSEVFKEDVFCSIAPHADDLWFWAMSVLGGINVRQVYSYESTLTLIDGSQATSLSQENVAGNQNDKQLKAIFSAYPSILAIMKSARRQRYIGKLRTVASSLACIFTAPIAYFAKHGLYNGLKLLAANSFSAKSIRGMVKQFVPYGLMCIWLERTYGIVLDVPLFFYPSFSKRVRRIIKFAMPYGIILAFRRRKYGPTPL